MSDKKLTNIVVIMCLAGLAVVIGYGYFVGSSHEAIETPTSIDAGPTEDYVCAEMIEAVANMHDDLTYCQGKWAECRNELDACKESKGVWKAMYRICVHEKLRVKR